MLLDLVYLPPCNLEYKIKFLSIAPLGEEMKAGLFKGFRALGSTVTKQTLARGDIRGPLDSLSSQRALQTMEQKGKSFSGRVSPVGGKGSLVWSSFTCFMTIRKREGMYTGWSIISCGDGPFRILQRMDPCASEVLLLPFPQPPQHPKFQKDWSPKRRLLHCPLFPVKGGHLKGTWSHEMKHPAELTFQFNLCFFHPLFRWPHLTILFSGTLCWLSS